ERSLIDEQLSKDMDALLRLVSLGSAARNSVKIKVRQPLAELRVQPADEGDRRAVERFADQIQEELNIKKVSLHDPAAGRLLRTKVRLNMQKAGPKFGPRLKEVQTALERQEPIAIFEKLQVQGKPLELAGSAGIISVALEDVLFEHSGPDGWAGLFDRGTAIALDVRITKELKREGLAREVVRHVQNARKDAGLNMEDRIVLYLGTDSEELRQAIETHRSYIAAETLVQQW